MARRRKVEPEVTEAVEAEAVETDEVVEVSEQVSAYGGEDTKVVLRPAHGVEDPDPKV